MNCRICIADERIEDLIAPCKCCGSIKWVHRDCLDEWRRSDGVNGERFWKCGVCKEKYCFENNYQLVLLNLNYNLIAKLLSILVINLFISFLDSPTLFFFLQKFHTHLFPEIEFHLFPALIIFEIFIVGLYTLYKMKILLLLILFEANVKHLIFSFGLFSIWMEYKTLQERERITKIEIYRNLRVLNRG